MVARGITIRGVKEMRVQPVVDTMGVGDKGKAPMPPTVVEDSDLDDDI